MVENAIKHGLAPKEGPGLLVVTAQADDERVLIEVRDTGLGMGNPGNPHRSGAGVGLNNVRRRLQLCFGTESDLVIESDPTGTRVRFAVPLSSPVRVPAEEVAEQATNPLIRAN